MQIILKFIIDIIISNIVKGAIDLCYPKEKLTELLSYTKLGEPVKSMSGKNVVLLSSKPINMCLNPSSKELESVSYLTRERENGETYLVELFKIMHL